MIFAEDSAVHARLVVVAFKVGDGHETNEIFVAVGIFGEQSEVVAAGINAGFFLFKTALGHVGFNPDDRLDAFGFACFIKFNCAVHVAVVSESDRCHAGLFCDLHHVRNFGESIEEGIVGVGVEMNEFGAHDGDSIANTLQLPSMVHHKVIGIDEAGRGPIAGPVSVAALQLKITNYKLLISSVGVPLRDSKKLTAAQREKWFAIIKEWQKEGILDFTVTLIPAKEIDRIGINSAIQKALDTCLSKLSAKNSYPILLDGGLHAPKNFKNQKTIIKGDEKEPVIALASICAKVTRDRRMSLYAKQFPEYLFDTHKGYGTKKHYQCLKKSGLCALHRKSFLSRFVSVPQ